MGVAAGPHGLHICMGHEPTGDVYEPTRVTSGSSLVWKESDLPPLWGAVAGCPQERLVAFSLVACPLPAATKSSCSLLLSPASWLSLVPTCTSVSVGDRVSGGASVGLGYVFMASWLFISMQSVAGATSPAWTSLLLQV